MIAQCLCAEFGRGVGVVLAGLGVEHQHALGRVIVSDPGVFGLLR